MSLPVARTPMVTISATYDVGRWIVVIVRPNGRDAGATATVFDVRDAAFPWATTLWAAIVIGARERGILLDERAVEVGSSNVAVRQWTGVAVD